MQQYKQDFIEFLTEYFMPDLLLASIEYGGYISIIKFVVFLALFFLWLLLVIWVNEDAEAIGGMPIEVFSAADDWAEDITPDGLLNEYPAWHGWALREAFYAGVKWMEGQA